jgi:tRNA A37 methylthiotransferase MiaB
MSQVENGQKTVGFHTLGCKVNQSETEAMTALFLQKVINWAILNNFVMCMLSIPVL